MVVMLVTTTIESLIAQRLAEWLFLARYQRGMKDFRFLFYSGSTVGELTNGS